MINIKELKSDYSLTLHRINMDILGELKCDFIDTLSRGTEDIDEIKFTVCKYSYVHKNNRIKKQLNPIFNELKEERFICLDDNECFVIKEVDSDEYYKSVTARSREVKLGKIDITIEDLGFRLYSSDITKKIYSLNDYMKDQTGWSLGTVNEKVAYNINSEGNKTEKMRWQESVSSNWYDFLMKNIKEQFGCVVTFDSYNKKVNLLDYDSFGDDIQLYLSHDNYIKSLKHNSSTNDIVTRLTLVGKEEMNIIGATETGYPYLEDYSYFIDNGEMSSGLVAAILKYQEMIKIRRIRWKELVDEKVLKQSTLKTRQDELSKLYADIKANERLLETHRVNEDDVNYAKIAAILTELKEDQEILEITIGNLEKEVESLQSSIDNINILCKRETATNEDGQLIFNEYLLNELKEFIYCETYTNDSFINVEDLVESGKRELSLKSTPTFTWSIDSVNFMRRIIDNKFRQHWNGTVSLGDIIVLYDKADNKEELVYLVGYTQNFKDKSLSLELSNHKVKEDKQRMIMDYINNAKKAMTQLDMKKYLFIEQKYNRINLPKELINNGN